MSDGASFETDRWRDDQPPRDDLIDPDEVEEDVEVEPVDADEGVLPDPEDLPESQGADVLDAERLTEDAGSRPPLSDEERGDPRR